MSTDREYKETDFLDFGKYNGTQLSRVICDDPKYIQWLIDDDRILLSDDAYELWKECMEEVCGESVH